MIISMFVKILQKNFETDFTICNYVDFGSWSSSGLEYRSSFWYRDAVLGIRLPHSVFIIH